MLICFCAGTASACDEDGDYEPTAEHRQVVAPTRESIDSLVTQGGRAFGGMQPDDLRYLINSIYACYGYPFRKPEIRSRFYSAGSQYREDPQFEESKIPEKHRRFIEYLLKVERWKLQLAQKRSKGLLSYEAKKPNRQVTFEELGSLLAVDHERGVSFMLDNRHLLVLKYPDFIPIRQLELPATVAYASEFLSVLSPNGKYLALRYYHTTKEKLKCVMILIDTGAAAILHEIPAGFGENRSHAQFSRDSKLLLTAAGAYEVATGNLVKQWIYPTDHKIQNIAEVLTMYHGMLKDGSLLVGCWALNRIYRVDPSDGAYTVFLDLDKEGLSVPSGWINDDGELLAAVVRKTKMVGNQQTVVRSDFIIWKVLPDHTLQQIYSEAVTGKEAISSWTWGKGYTILKATIDNANRYQLWRYDIIGGKVSLTHIPIEGLSGGQNEISVNNYFVATYGPRLWDIETGRKVSPWYEAIYPFDTSNRMPLYDERPAAITLKDFWSD
jgi:hypothetical protein